MTTSIYLVKKSDLRTSSPKAWRAFRISNLDTLTWDVNTPVTPMPLPEDSHEENILVKMEGNSASMNVSWRIIDGEANFGTLGSGLSFTEDSTISTTFETISEYKNNFIPTTMTDGYEIQIIDDILGFDRLLTSDKGTISNLSFSVSGDSPVVWNANLTFMIGNSIALFEADVPPAPSKATGVDLTTTKHVRISWTPFDGYASAGDAEPITGISIDYRTSSDPSWTEIINSDLVSGTLGCDDCTTLLAAPDYRDIIMSSAGTYQFRLSLSGENTEASSVKHRIYALNASAGRDIVVT